MAQKILKPIRNKANWSFFLVLSMVLRLSIVIYVQDSQVTYNPGTASLYLISSLSSGWVSSTKYAMGLWLNKISWNHTSTPWDMIATIVQNYSDNSSRSLIIQLNPNEGSCFAASAPDNWSGSLVPWEGDLSGTSLSPVGTWIFFATGVDSIAQINYGFRYYLNSGSSTYQYLGTRSDSFYTLSYANTALYVGGVADPNYPNTLQNAYGYMQYMRLFLDYTPTSVDEFLNIALMDSASNLYLFYFASDTGINNNQTFIVSSVSSSSQTNTVGVKGFDTSVSLQNVSFGAYNILMCRPGQIASFPLHAAIIKKGLVVALDFYPYSSTQATQTIFSIRDTGTNVISLRFDYFASSGALDVLINPVSSTTSTTSYYAFSSTGVSVPAITKSSWNRVIVEIIQTQPLETGTGFSSARIWVNSAVTTRAYFGNFSTGDTAIADGNSAALDICGAYDPTSANLVSMTLTGDFDILNMLWITGSEGVFQNSTDASCQWRVFIAPSQASCLMCASGYYMQDNQECVAAASSNSYFLHSPTNSYQKCYYGQYYNQSSGVCSQCTGDGQLISAPQCINCDPTCRACTGTAATQCTACYDGTYLYLSQCVSNCPAGYYQNTADSQCISCDPIFLDQNGTCFQLSCLSFNEQCQQMDIQTSQAVSQVSSTVRVAAPAIGIGLLSSQAIFGATSSSQASSLWGIHLLMLLKYINAGYPPNLESFFDIYSHTALSKDSSPVPEPFLFLHVSNPSQYQSTWYRFAEYDATVNFLPNCGTAGIICLFSLAMILILEILKKCTQPKATWFESLLYRFKWNLILSCITSNHSKLILGWFLQFLAPVYDTYGSINFVVALCSFIAVVITLIISIRHAKWNGEVIQNQEAQIQDQDYATSKQKRFAFLTNDYKIESMIGRYFFIVSFLRIALFVTIIFWQPLVPILQGFFLLLVSIFYILLLVFGKPFKDAYKLAAILFNEVILLIQEILVLVFVFNKQKDFLSLSQGMTMGWIFIGFIFLFLVGNVFFGIFIPIRTLILSRRKKKNDIIELREEQKIELARHREHGEHHEHSQNQEQRGQTDHSLNHQNRLDRESRGSTKHAENDSVRIDFVSNDEQQRNKSDLPSRILMEKSNQNILTQKLRSFSNKGINESQISSENSFIQK